MIGFLVIVACFALVVAAGRWLAKAGTVAGDRPLDASSRLLQDGWATRLVVHNPGPQPVVVGVTQRHRRVTRLDNLRPHLVIRSARWYERLAHDRGASMVLGVVEPSEENGWDLPELGTPSKVVVVLGLADSRLRVHEHLTPHFAGRAVLR